MLHVLVDPDRRRGNSAPPALRKAHRVLTADGSAARRASCAFLPGARIASRSGSPHAPPIRTQEREVESRHER